MLRTFPAETRMDAQELNRKVARAVPHAVRLLIAWLAAVLAVGLWQGYAAWLMGGDNHVA